MKKKLFFILLSTFTLCVLTTSCFKDDDDEPSSPDGTEDTIVSPNDNDDLITEVDNTPENETDNTQLIDTDWELVEATGQYRYYGHEVDEAGVRDKWDETETIEDIEDLPFEWDELYFRAEKRAYWDYYPAAHNQTEQAMPYIYKNGTLTIIFTNEQYNPGDKNEYNKVYESGGKRLEMATGTWVVRDTTATWTCKYTYIDEDGSDVYNEVGPLVLTFERQTDDEDDSEDDDNSTITDADLGNGCYLIDGLCYQVAEGDNGDLEACIVPYANGKPITDESIAGEGNYSNLSGMLTIPSTITINGQEIAVTATSKWCFYECTTITGVVIPQNIQIGVYCFGYCKELSSVQLPEGITFLPQGMFADCTKLLSITIPNSVTEIGPDVFMNTGISSIEIHQGVTKIGGWAFRWCLNLSSIEFPNAIEYIADYVCYHCSTLTTVTIPAGVTYIMQGAFLECPQLKTITCLAVTPPTIYDFKEDTVFDNKGLGITLRVPAGSVDAYKATSQWNLFTIEAIEE